MIKSSDENKLLVRKIIISKLILFLMLLISFSESKALNVDSLKNFITNYPRKDTVLLKSYTKLIDNYSRVDPKLALQYIDTSFIIAKELGDDKSLLQINNLRGTIYFNLGDFKKAQEIFSKTEIEARRLNDSLALLKSLVNQGNANKGLFKNDISIEFFSKALNLANLLNDNKAIALIKNSLHSIYKMNNNFENAESLLRDAIKINENDNRYEELFVNYQNMAGLKIQIGKTKEAIEYFDKALKIIDRVDSDIDKAFFYHNFGVYFASIGNQNKAIYYFKKSLVFAQNYDHKNLIFYLNINISKSYLVIKNHPKTLIYLKHADSITNTFDNKYYSSLVNFMYYQYFFSLSNYQKSLEYYKKYVDLDKQNDSIEKAQRIDSLVIAFNSQIEKQELEKLKIENQLKQDRLNNQQIIILTSIFIFLLLIALIIIIYLRYKEKRSSHQLLEEKNVQIESANIELTQLNETLFNSEAELIEAGKTKDRFLSIIAHDLRNPIGALMNLSELLHNNSNRIDDTEKVKIFKTLNDTSKSTVDLLENLLTWGRIQSKKVDFSPADSLIVPLIDHNIKLFKPALEEKRISVDIDVSKELNANVDFSMFSTIISNLLSNAIKFSNPGGKISLRAEDKEDQIMIEIADNGLGMNNEQIEMLFNLDQKFTRKGTNNEKGTGLGFNLVLEFLKYHDATIRVESEENKGSKFIMAFPK